MNKRQRKNPTKVAVLYSLDWMEALLDMPGELRLKIDDAIKRYVLYGDEPEDSAIKYSMFALIKQTLDANADKYEAVCRKRSEAGKLGGAPKGNTNAIKEITSKTTKNKQNKQKQPDTDTESDNDTESFYDSVCVNAHARETHTLDEISKISDDEKRYREFNRLFKEKAPTFHAHTGDVEIAYINHLKEHATVEDILEAIEEIEDKFAGGNKEYNNAVTTIRKFLQCKKKWKT